MENSQLFCVEYPGTIKDDNKMLQTLGGYQHINETFSQPNRKLELRFRPNTPGCKATCAERSKTSSLLLKGGLHSNLNARDLLFGGVNVAALAVLCSVAKRQVPTTAARR